MTSYLIVPVHCMIEEEIKQCFMKYRFNVAYKYMYMKQWLTSVIVQEPMYHHCDSPLFVIPREVNR